MALDFDGTNDSISFGDIPAISNLNTISCSIWCWNDAITADMNIVEDVDRVIVPNEGWRFYFDDIGSISGRTDVYNIVINESAAGGNGSVRIESATSSAVSGAWQHLFWSAVAASSTGLQLWIAGAEDANSPADISSLADLGLSAGNGTIKLAEQNPVGGGGADRDGKLAEIAFWNRVLTDSEIISLSKGFSPLFMPDGLIFYAPLIGRASPEPDIKGGTTGTLANNTTNFPHPRIIYPYGDPTGIKIPTLKEIQKYAR